MNSVSNQNTSSTVSKMLPEILDYPMKINSGHFHKQLEQEDSEKSSEDENPTQVSCQDEDKLLDSCACFAFAPNFSIDVMWEKEDAHPNAKFEELEFRSPFDKTSLGFFSNEPVTKMEEEGQSIKTNLCSNHNMTTLTMFDNDGTAL